MKIKIGFALLVALTLLNTTGCGMKVMTNGRVVDAATNKQIEGAAVAIHWVHEKFALPGLGSNDENIGTTETLTDAQGRFTIPRYLNRTPYMGVYKEGYVCWSSETIFNPHGEVYEEIFQKRRPSYRITDGMLIQLQPMPSDISPKQRERHANFTLSVETRLWTSGPFESAIRIEKEIYVPGLKRNSKEK